MSGFNLHRLFNPKSVAVVGASEKRGSIGFSIMRNLLKNGFRGDIFPVNPKYKSIMGLSSVASIEDIGSDVDTAVIAISIQFVPQIVESCGRAGLSGVVIISSSGRETGEKGRAIEAKILEKARKYNLRIIGPNCLGIVNTSKAFNASVAHLFPLPGKTAFLSQSADICTSVLDFADCEKIGFSHFVNLGSMIDVDVADMIDYWGSLNSVKTIALYIEKITNIRNFMSAARSVSRVKPIIVLKPGRSKASVAAFYAGAPGGEDAVFDAAFRRAGILRVTELEELLDCSEFLAKLNRPSGPELKIITNVVDPASIVTYDLPERTARGFKNLYQYGRNIETLLEIPVRTDTKLIINRSKAENIIKKAIADGAQSLTEIQIKNLLWSYGIPVNVPDVVEYELMIGVKTDPNFGPIIFLGMGGVLTEAFRNTSMGLPPLNRLLARQMIEDTQISRMLKGSRNFELVSIPLLGELLIRTSRLVTDFPEITALDINLIMVKNGSIMAVDGSVLLSVPRVPSPMHLVISTYPWQYEKKEYTVNGHEFFIRPIRPSDADLLIDHFYSLSPRSVYMRFFSPVKELSKTTLIKLTQIDYDREIALVALMGKGQDKKIVGVCRIILEADKTLGEFALAISDEWQGKGIGSSLLKLCLKASQSKGVKQVVGVVLAENTQMLMLGKKLGFSVKRHPDSGEYDLIIDFKDMHIDYK
ncbi:GNAT family N-acetyltransferase [Desulfobacula sp.]|uniref:bifunctional acetate--CoA ligase family protein/GNAT family N-acetyltransferase n=1 Tax=Desulfobacula sp. TaxID=2593537 RepID=UPI0025C6AA38|nr:GNAT family N-acetyltransferase [Desulfobacula sp.]MBC2703183.1 GNAT family N-acetyltransferase [Desulfobacula sp.]